MQMYRSILPRFPALSEHESRSGAHQDAFPKTLPVFLLKQALTSRFRRATKMQLCASMRKFLAIAVAAALGFALGYFTLRRQLATEHELAVANLQNTWQSERAELERALEEARSGASKSILPNARQSSPGQIAVAHPSATELIQRLRALAAGPGNGQATFYRRVVHDLEELIALGKPALPAIREFLDSGDDAQLSVTPNGGGVLTSLKVIVGTSLRLELLDVAKRIGGPEAEALLADTLAKFPNARESHWLITALQEMSPEKYRDLAVSVARRLAESPPTAGKGGDRETGFKILSELRDASYVQAAQQQLIRADGQVDRSALNYLHSTLGQQVLPLVAQWYDDSRITDPQKKEPFARVALNYVGADATANAFYVKAINDFGLSNDQRKNLIEDLNQDGFANRKNLSENDLPLINNRMALIEQLVPATTDQVNLKAMKEAYKDLVKMRERITVQQSIK
jgi:hypothetical protein